jgi:pimeloyl-ACP methyl ester carboxylesterase
MDQSPRILNDATFRDGLFGEDQEEVLGSWGPLLSELEAQRGTPYARLPWRLRWKLASKLAQFFSYAFERRALHAATALVRLEVLAKRVLHVENWPLYLDAMVAYRTCDYDFRPSLPRVKIPMHVFVGMKSRMYPPAGQIAMQELVPHARVVRFERSGHAMIADEPLGFVRAMREFLREG